jgi:predicted nuclease with TOPRIM domain
MDDLGEIRQRREAVVGAAAALEAALATPATDPRWTEGLGNALEHLRATLDEHVTATEAPGGMIDQLRARAPRLSNRIDRLVDEHSTITADVQRLLEHLEHAPTERTATDTAAIREQTLELLGEIVRHRHLGADLLYEAYDVDVGGPG